jgi:hypothetical protein
MPPGDDPPTGKMSRGSPLHRRRPGPPLGPPGAPDRRPARSRHEPVRAGAQLRILTVAELGVPPEALVMPGYGAQQLLADRHEAAERATQRAAQSLQEGPDVETARVSTDAAACRLVGALSLCGASSAPGWPTAPTVNDVLVAAVIGEVGATCASAATRSTRCTRSCGGAFDRLLLVTVGVLADAGLVPAQQELADGFPAGAARPRPVA